eukprot:6475499-Amphidinium_carterae.1
MLPLADCVNGAQLVPNIELKDVFVCPLEAPVVWKLCSALLWELKTNTVRRLGYCVLGLSWCPSSLDLIELQSAKVEYVEYAAPTAVEYMAPAPAQYMAAAPAVEYVAPAPAQYMAEAPAMVEYVAPAAAVEYVAPAPPQYIAAAPQVEYARSLAKGAS